MRNLEGLTSQRPSESSVLSVKYVILHKIGLGNWLSSSHGSGVSPPVAQLIFQLGTSVHIDFGTVIYEQILRHVDSFVV